MEDGRDTPWLAICTCRTLAAKLSLLENQVPQRKVEEWLP